MWRRSGFSPSEPVFVPRPDSTAEDDGVLITLASKIDENEPVSWFFVLDAHNLRELAAGVMIDQESARAIHVPVGFHSYWVKQDVLVAPPIISEDSPDLLEQSSGAHALFSSALLLFLAGVGFKL